MLHTKSLFSGTRSLSMCTSMKPSLCRIWCKITHSYHIHSFTSYSFSWLCCGRFDYRLHRHTLV